MDADAAQEVPIADDVIRLGQLLKLADVVGSGGEIKAFLAVPGAVRVNGVAEDRRGRQLRDGDLVEAAGRRLRIVASAG